MTAAWLWSGSAYACDIADFAIENLKVEVASKCDNNKCPRVVFAGNLVNKCSTAAAAKIRFVVFDKDGTPIEILEDWTTAPDNLPPGGAYPFVRKTSNLWTPAMAKFTHEVVAVRKW